LELYVERQSPLHRLDPRTKLVFSLVGSLCLLATSNLLVVLGWLALTHALLLGAGIPPRRIRQVWRVMLPLLVMVPIFWAVFYQEGTVLIALTLAPLILALSKGSAWGWASAATLGSLAVAALSGFAFVAVERRMAVPLLDLALLRNRVLVGATIAILIGAGTINALMYLLSLYFQDPNALGFSPLQAGLATLPATAGLVAIAPFVPKLAAHLGGRQVIGAGFLLTAVGFAAIGLVDADWRYGLFLLPLIAVAVGMGLSNGPASSASTACVSVNQVGAASGVSNMARYVGAAVATSLAATIYGAVIGDRAAEGQPPGDALASGLAAASWVMAAFSFAGFLMAFVMGRHRASRGTLNDAAAAAAAGTHTLPTSATPVETSSA
jgi:energy-coupling factor transporter transmembrane protein EcfT